MDVDYCAEERLQQLRERLTHCVCKYCGGELRLKRMLFHQEEGLRIEIFCQQCERIEFGVERNESTKRMTIAKVCEIIAWADQKRGFLAEAGFQIPVKTLENLVEEIIFVDSQAAERLLEEAGSNG